MAARDRILPVMPPFRLDFTAWALRRRKTNGVDRWEENRYSRVLLVAGQPVRIVAAQEGDATRPRLRLTLQTNGGLSRGAELEAARTVGTMLGLGVDLGPFYDLVAGHPLLRELTQDFVGLKPPRFPTLFEALVNAVACQQLTLDVGLILLNRLAEEFGVPFTADGVTQPAFPAPEALAGAPADRLRLLGFSTAKALSLGALSRAFCEEPIDEARLASLPDQEIVARLTGLRGIGRWSAEYALLRGLGRWDVFPGDDVGAGNNLQRLFGLDHRPGYDETRRLTAPWKPYAGLVYFHMLLWHLRQKKMIQPAATDR